MLQGFIIWSLLLMIAQPVKKPLRAYNRRLWLKTKIFKVCKAELKKSPPRLLKYDALFFANLHNTKLCEIVDIGFFFWDSHQNSFPNNYGTIDNENREGSQQDSFGKEKSIANFNSSWEVIMRSGTSHALKKAFCFQAFLELREQLEIG